MTGARSPIDVTHAFTLKSRWLTSALLRRYKMLENRSTEFKSGWYAVHTGVSKTGDEWAEKHVREACDTEEEIVTISEDISSGCVPKGHIAGLCRVSHCLPVASCGHSKWALGPVCNVIEQTVWFETPIAHAGQLGTWPLNESAICALQHQVGRCAIASRPHVLEEFPPDGVALLRMRAQNRATKRKQRAGEDVCQPKLAFAKS